MPDGYCQNGVHFIGEAEECWKCDLWEQRQAAARCFHAARRAYALARAVDGQ